MSEVSNNPAANAYLRLRQAIPASTRESNGFDIEKHGYQLIHLQLHRFPFLN